MMSTKKMNYRTKVLAAVVVGAASAGSASTAYADAAVAWGVGGNGQLGNGSFSSSTTPVNVTGLSSGVTVVAGGGTIA